MEQIIDSLGKEYMSEFLTDLPDNTMLNKVLTGCGGTTVALSNDVPYVICVPFRSMITNKLMWAEENGKDICPVMGGVLDKTIAAYRGNKYMVTYDSLPRMKDFIDTRDYKILIDESHKLIDSASFRNDAVELVIENYKRYGSFVFMTGTPVKDKYQLDELKRLAQARIQWYGIKEVYIKTIVPKRPLREEIAIISARHLTGSISSNAHIFMNSINSIIEIIQTIDPRIVSTERINIVCALNDKNKNKLHDTLGKDWEIKNVGDVAKVNFYTATAFEGSDIYDQNGKTYVVTDGLKDYTKNDILTTLPQIIGRVRDSKYKNDIDLIYTSSPYLGKGVTEEKFCEIVKGQLNEAKGFVELHNSTEIEFAKEGLYQKAEDHKFIKQHKNKVLTVNYLAAHYEMHSFAALNTTYYAFPNRVEGASSNALVNSVPYTYVNGLPATLSVTDMILLKTKKRYPDILKFLVDNLADESLTANIRAMYPEMVDYINLLGVEKIAALKYRKKGVRDEFTKESTAMKNPVKIVRMLNYRTNQFISNAEVKRRMTEIYKELGIKKCATASDIEQYYEVRDKFKKNEESGVTVRGYEVVMCKFRLPSDDVIRSKNVSSSLLQALIVPPSQNLASGVD